MKRRSRKRRSSGTHEIGKYVAGGILLLIVFSIVGIFAFKYATAITPPHLRADNQCPEEGWRSATIVLLDTSDGLPPAARMAVTKLLTDEAELAPIYGLFEIRTLAPDQEKGRIVFSKCNPGDGLNDSALTSNVGRTRKRWSESYRQPLNDALESGLQTTKAKNSPIMASLQSIAADRFTGRSASAMSKRLVIVSDMIEHSPDYSQYNGDLSYEKFKSGRAFKKFFTDLNGASVKVYYIQRLTSRPLNSGDHIRFWSDWIAGSNGRLFDAEKLPGAT